MEANKALQDAVILIPSLEPDERLPRYVQTLADSGFGHLVIVDDGSGAPSQEIFDRIARMDDRIQVLHHEVNRGKGVALKTGYRWIREHLPEISGVITADADGQHTVKDCIRLAEELEKGKRALYLGSRDFNLPHVPPKSRFGNKCTSVVFRLCHGVWLPDTQTGLRAFRREDLDFMIGVEGERYEYEMNVLIRCAREGLEMIPVPIETVYENDNEGTHFHPIRDSWRIYKVILGSFFRYVGASLFCTALDQGLAAALREWLLPLAGFTGDAAIMTSGYIARAVSAVVNFLLNKNLVFRVKNGARGAAIRYFVLALAAITASNLLVQGLVRLGMAAWLAKLLVDTVLYFVNFYLQQRWVFRETPAGNEDQTR